MQARNSRLVRNFFLDIATEIIQLSYTEHQKFLRMAKGIFSEDDLIKWSAE